MIATVKKWIAGIGVVLFIVGAMWCFGGRNTADNGSMDVTKDAIERANNGVDGAQQQINNTSDAISDAENTANELEGTVREQSTIVRECQQIVRDCQSRFEQITEIFSDVDNQNEKREAEKSNF